MNKNFFNNKIELFVIILMIIVGGSITLLGTNGCHIAGFQSFASGIALFIVGVILLLGKLFNVNFFKQEKPFPPTLIIVFIFLIILFIPDIVRCFTL